MIDLYTKAVLGVIAVALTVIAVQGAMPRAAAQFGGGCGALGTACHVQWSHAMPVKMSQY